MSISLQGLRSPPQPGLPTAAQVPGGRALGPGEGRAEEGRDDAGPGRAKAARLPWRGAARYTKQREESANGIWAATESIRILVITCNYVIAE